MADIRTLKLALLADTKDFIDKLDGADKEARSFGDKLGGALKKGALAFAALGAAAGAAAVKIGIDALGAASDFSEEISKSGELFGTAQKDVQAFAETAARKLGQTRQEALAAANNFAIFGRAAGLSGKDLTDFSTDFVSLASDLASFNNTSPEDAINAIGAALRGEAEPIRRYGILLNDATLKQEALALGIIKTTKGSLTPQQKVLAAQAAIYKQSATAQGDFERTSGGLANQQRILRATIEDLKISLGTALLPIALEVFKFFSQTAVPVLEKVINTVKGLISTVDLDFGQSMKNAKNIFEPVLNGLKTAFNTVRDAIDRNREKLQPLYDLMEALWEFTKTYLIPILIKGLGDAFILIGNIIAGVIDFIGILTEKITSVVKTIQSFIDKIQNAIDKARELASLVGNAFTASANPNLTALGKGGVNLTINNNVNGALDPQKVARQIVKVQDTALRTTGLRAFSQL